MPVTTPKKVAPGCSVTGGEFAGCNFAHGDLHDCTFSDCDFAGCNFRGANLSHTSFEHCEFNDSAAEHPADFSQSTLRECHFQRCNLSVVDILRCSGYGLVFEHCQMQGADLSKSDFTLPIGDTRLADLIIRDCNFSFGNLSNNYLAGCEITSTRMIEACLDYVDLSKSNLQDSELHNIAAIGLIITDADLRGATFNNLNPRDIDLEGVKLHPSQLLMLVEPLGVDVQIDAE